MKTLRKMCAVMALACLFSVATNAGEMHAGYTNPPPPPPTQATGEAAEETGDALSETLASLLSGLLAVL